ncbi:Adhesive plaque matrix protein 2 [Mytilus coruscus]|uniref:Adhesive plaque matrix protein 2 n=1 Tax=Mytilus coruscus TaxID=42192 RepID=A0A6J8CFL1_MYTCO|nr:Adhesive plaque matrix protein 2 [Mytilus coruscus]
MVEQVELVNILQTEHFQSGDNFQDNVLNIKLSEIHKASRKRDKLILAFIVAQLFCVSLPIAANFVYLNEYLCAPNPCRNGGKCSSDGSGSCKCKCYGGYSGPTCNEGRDGYRCKCVGGYSGPTCDKNVCKPNPCQNRGRCYPDNSDDGYKCRCVGGYKGPICEG